MSQHLADLYVLDVDQGDSIVLHLASHEVIVVDCHRSGCGKPATVRLLDALASKRGTYDIDLLCLTHPDSDHYSGIPDLLDWVKEKGGKIKQLVLYAPGPQIALALLQKKRQELEREPIPKDEWITKRLARFNFKERTFETLFTRLMEIGKANPYTFQQAVDFTELGAVGMAQVYAVGPRTTTVEKYSTRVYAEMIEGWISDTPVENLSANAISCVLWVHIGRVRILLTGDATCDALDLAIKSYYACRLNEQHGDLTSNIVKASHHGSKHNSSEAIWCKTLKPGGYVAFSAGGYQSYRHPHKLTIDHIRMAQGKWKNKEECHFACTNICEDMIDALTAGAFPLEVTNQLNDDTLDPPKDESVHLSKDQKRYHGDLQFAIDDKGEITFIPKCVPAEAHGARICRYH